jgi:hypothetical protein
MPNDLLENSDFGRFLIQPLAAALLWVLDTKRAGVEQRAHVAYAEADYLRRLRAVVAPLAPSSSGLDPDDEPPAGEDDPPEDERTPLACVALDALAEGDTLAFMRAAMAYDSRIDFTTLRSPRDVVQGGSSAAPSVPSPQQPAADAPAAPPDPVHDVDPEAPTEPAPPKPSP